MVTAYDAPSGRLADAAGVDLILVGDSAAMIVLGHDSTVPATMEEMLVLTRAVTRGARRPLVVADMPFGSFQVSDEEAMHNAIRFVKEAGADAVKLEGAGPTLSRVRGARRRRHPRDGPPRPDAAVGDDARRLQGAGPDGRRRRCGSYEDALALEAAGCFAIVLEAVPAPVAARITEALTMPTIGIGAGAGTRRAGARLARPARPLRGPRAALRQAVRRPRRPRSRRRVGTFVEDVRDRRFPEEQHTYAMPEEELALFEEALEDVRERR